METQFPKSLSYNIKALSAFSKQSCRLTPDKWDSIKPGDTIKVALPQNTLVDLRTLSMYYEAIGDTDCHMPRLSSSIIKTLSIYINGNLIERIDNYSVLYNKLYDMDGGGADQTSKRFLENADPSVFYTTGLTKTSVETGAFNITGNSSAVKRKFAINNWLGFISTLSTPIIDTNDLNKVEIEITFESKDIVWKKSTNVAMSAPGYTLSDVHFMVTKVVFNDPLYYNLKASKLLSSGLTIGYQTYIASRGALAVKSTSYNVYTSFNTTSLDQLIGCFTPETVAADNLLLYDYADGDTTADVLPFNNIKNLAAYSAETSSTFAGGLYNQVVYFQSNACGLTSSTWEINNTPIIPIPLADYEVYNESLIALGHNHIDMGVGTHEGLNSLAHFLKFYFVHVCSLEMINAGDFYKSGLDGKSSALNVVWKLVFGTTVEKLVPYIFAKTTRILQINEGHSVTVIV